MKACARNFIFRAPFGIISRRPPRLLSISQNLLSYNSMQILCGENRRDFKYNVIEKNHNRNMNTLEFFVHFDFHLRNKEIKEKSMKLSIIACIIIKFSNIFIHLWYFDFQMLCIIFIIILIIYYIKYNNLEIKIYI